MNATASEFDTGNWSDVNGLPGQQDMLNYLCCLVSSDPNRCFTRRQLMDEVAKEFNIPTTAVEAEGPKSSTPAYYTRLTYLITDAVNGVRRANTAFLKRIAVSCYQHVSGNGKVSKEFSSRRVNFRNVRQAEISVKLLRGLGWDSERIFIELIGTLGWSESDIETAVNNIFN